VKSRISNQWVTLDFPTEGSPKSGLLRSSSLRRGGPPISRRRALTVQRGNPKISRYSYDSCTLADATQARDGLGLRGHSPYPRWLAGLSPVSIAAGLIFADATPVASAASMSPYVSTIVTLLFYSEIIPATPASECPSVAGSTAPRRRTPKLEIAIRQATPREYY